MFQCVHCDEMAIVPHFLEDDKERNLPFCCSGCLTVYELLKQKSLSSYYEIKKSSAVFKRRSPVEVSRQVFTYLDDERFENDHCYKDLEDNCVMDFYLEGIHCLACLWLIEKLHEFTEGVVRSKLDLDKSIVSVTINDLGKFSQVARELDKLGYRPHALKRNGDAKKLQEKEERTYLKRLGVAGAAAGNIMIYSISLYGGADESMAKVFNTLTVVLALPVFTYSAWPFYQSAMTSIKNKTLSIDIPIAMSLIMGFAMGGWGLFHGFEENYFDSLTALVFLLLLSRYFLRKIQDKGLSATDLHYFYQNESVLKQTDFGYEEVHTQFLKVGDVIKVRPEEFIPADGKVIKGESLINNSLLTGESFPDHVKVGQAVFSGTQNVSNELTVKVEKTTEDTRLGKILKNVEQGWALRSRTVDLTSKVAKYFTITVILLSVLLFTVLLFEKDFTFAMTRALTLLIVTCPCALAISVPLTFHRSLSQAAKNGIIVKSDEVFEKLASAKTIMLDKTGTITHGKLEVIKFSSKKDLTDIIYSLEKNSRHPVGRALTEFALRNGASPLEVSFQREIPGKGVEGKIGDNVYIISRGEVRENGDVIARYHVNDAPRSDSRPVITRLKEAGLQVAIISGDRADVVHSLSVDVGIDKTFAEVSPEEKVKLVKMPGTIMVGDGANDAMALEGADVGIAVSGAMDISLRASDVFLSTPGLSGVEKLLVLSRETMKVVRRNLVFSIIYNSLSVIFVFTGMISPLVAAIVMPLSSLTVLLSTLLGTKEMRALWKS